MPLVKYLQHIELRIVGELEACYLWLEVYRLNHETLKGWSNRTPDALRRPYVLLLFIVVLFLDLLLVLFFILFILIITGNSVHAVFFWPSSIIGSLLVSFSSWWFEPESIEHVLVDSIINIVVSGTGDANQVCGQPCTHDNYYDTVGLVPMQKSVADSKHPIGRQTNALVLKLELLQTNNVSPL